MIFFANNIFACFNVIILCNCFAFVFVTYLKGDGLNQGG